MTGLKKKAFTMVELIIVIAIIAFLAVSATIVLTKFIWKSRDSRRLSDVSAISRAITTFISDADNNPTWTLPTIWLAKINYSSWTTEQIIWQWQFNAGYMSVLDFTSKSGKFNYLQKIPTDPKWSSYPYIIAVDAKWQRKFSLWATLEYVSNEVVWSKSAIDWNFTSWDKIVFYTTGALLNTWVWSLLFSGMYSSTWAYTIKWREATSGTAIPIVWWELSNTWFVYDWSTYAFPYQ